VWGALHGLGLAAERWWADHRRSQPDTAEPSRGRRVWHSIWTRVAVFHFVCLAWVFFRAETFASAFDVLGRLTAFGRSAPVNWVLVATSAGALAAQFVPRDLSGRLRAGFSRAPWAAQTAILALVLVVIDAL